MNQIQTISLHAMNNAVHFLFVSNMVTRAESDTVIMEKCATQVAGEAS